MTPLLLESGPVSLSDVIKCLDVYNEYNYFKFPVVSNYIVRLVSLSTSVVFVCPVNSVNVANCVITALL